ncbi:MAG: sulfurtransferase-like selenium metabolism protein YedF [Bacteroidales bacterium]|nr:MAG: sulfurtransferase-like selenium metabolism protein YedF [Bacteroidales bacterium]
MKTVDAKGKLCPLPLIMTKKALNEIADNETLEILIDNETSMKNVTRFLADHGMNAHVEKKGNVFQLLVNKTGVVPESAAVGEYCEVENPIKSNLVIAFQRNRLGEGAEELGNILIKAFVNTLPEVTLKPKTLIFLNSGIFLALKDSLVLDSLKKMEENGVEVLVCGTCLDYYKKKEDLGVGKISNMYDILERLTKANSVVYP